MYVVCVYRVCSASCNQKKAHHLLHELGWKLKNEPREPTPYELGVVSRIGSAGTRTSTHYTYRTCSQQSETVAGVLP